MKLILELDVLFTTKKKKKNTYGLIHIKNGCDFETINVAGIYAYFLLTIQTFSNFHANFRLLQLVVYREFSAQKMLVYLRIPSTSET